MVRLEPARQALPGLHKPSLLSAHSGAASPPHQLNSNCDTARQQDPYEVVLDLLRDEGEGMPQLMWTSRNFDDADICLCLQHAQCSVMSDTLAVSRHGPLKDTIGSHSAYG